MNQKDIRIVTLESMRVASAWSFGPGPEDEAWKKLSAWAGPQGLLDAPEPHRIFGFNNPNPSVGSPNYGYEFWIAVDETIEPEADIRIQNFRGGLYAVMAYQDEGGDLYQTIPAAWTRLDAWIAESKYTSARHQWLEEHSPQGKLLALYYPIAE